MVAWNQAGAFSFFAARFGSTLINDPSSASSFAAAAYTAAVILWVMAAQAALAIGERKPIWDALSEGQRKLLGMGPLVLLLMMATFFLMRRRHKYNEQIYLPIWRDMSTTDESAIAEVISYIPSLWEMDWRMHIKEYQKDPCKKMLQRLDVERSAEFLASLTNWRLSSQPLLSVEDFIPHDIFSYFLVQKNQKLLKIAIEPLVGYFRHPYAISQCTPQGQNTVHVLDLSYLVFRGMSLDAFNALYPGRKYLIDLGINGPNRSLLWFQERYNKMGIEFDEVWGWEKRELDPQSFWRYVPSSIYSKLHFMNVAVDLNFDERHPLEVIRNLYKDGDYVALKLDIDSPGFEEIIADRILDDPEILKILGDFYYEMHFGAPYFPYHNIPSNDSIYNMENVMAFFVQLRDKGLRAHYWV
ncbi:hypothetical protein Ndes2437B_g01026 [Nannochloris sp. 'desiccata']